MLKTLPGLLTVGALALAFGSSMVAAQPKVGIPSRTSEAGLKRPCPFAINHYIEDQKLHGLGGLSLGSNVMDPTRVREALANSIFRAAKVLAGASSCISHLDSFFRLGHNYVLCLIPNRLHRDPLVTGAGKLSKQLDCDKSAPPRQYASGSGFGPPAAPGDQKKDIRGKECLKEKS